MVQVTPVIGLVNPCPSMNFGSPRALFLPVVWPLSLVQQCMTWGGAVTWLASFFGLDNGNRSNT